jgi:DHA1 family bicyclomycin/chloramphenicol resistance-like MFS transporter
MPNSSPAGTVSVPVKNPMHRGEFIALIAMMFATIAFSIDSILPALPEIANELSPTDPNRAQLILIAFVLGMGVGTLFTGPLSDAFGRKTVIYGGAAVYILGAALAWQAQSLEMLLAARLLQGLGSAGPRVVAIAVVRDFYSGRAMARIMSIAMMIFTLVPAIAPLLGQAIMAFTGWRGIFVAFILFSATCVVWMAVRLPESLPREARRPFRIPLLWAAICEMVTHPTVRLSILVQTLIMGALFSLLTMVQPIYDVVFDRAESFPMWFGIVALISGSASMINAALVEKVGMRKMVTIALGGQIALTATVIVSLNLTLPEPWAFGVFVTWQATLFFMLGMTLGNLNAIAMEPMGHIAGMAASVTGAISTFLAALIALPVGQSFDGSVWPLAIGIFVMTVVAFVVMLEMGRIERRTGLRPN